MFVMYKREFRLPVVQTIRYRRQINLSCWSTDEIYKKNSKCKENLEFIREQFAEEGEKDKSHNLYKSLFYIIKHILTSYSQLLIVVCVPPEFWSDRSKNCATILLSQVSGPDKMKWVSGGDGKARLMSFGNTNELVNDFGDTENPDVRHILYLKIFFKKFIIYLETKFLRKNSVASKEILSFCSLSSAVFSSSYLCEPCSSSLYWPRYLCGSMGWNVWEVLWNFQRI